MSGKKKSGGRFRGFMALLLTVLMVAANVTSAMAADETGTQASGTASTAAVTYQPNGGTGDKFVTRDYEVGSKVEVLDNLTGDKATSEAPSFEKDKYSFIGWSTDKDSTKADLKAGDSLTVKDGGVTLYAVWKEDPETTESATTEAASETKAAETKASETESSETQESETNKKMRSLALTPQSESDYTFSISGTGDAIAQPGTKYTFLDGITWTPSDSTTWATGDEFQLAVTGVDTPTGGAYTYAAGDTGFTPAAADNGKTYTIHYEIQKKDASGSWVSLSTPFTATKDVTVYKVSTIKDDLTTDDAYVSKLAVTGIQDGVGPFDADDTAGNDSSDSNKIVRSFDSVTYELSYSDQVYTDGTAYKNGYMWFEFDLPYSSDKAAFDTSAMNWMSTDAGYKWTLTESNGKQVLKCAKKIETQEGNDSSIPGSGTLPVTIMVKGLPNGTEVQPTFKAWMDNNTTDGTCAAHSKDEVKTVQPDKVTVSAAPSYNIRLDKVSSIYVGASDTFDFSTGNDKALNKNAGKVKGRLQEYGITLQLYNKDSSKGLKGIELPTGDITLKTSFSAKYVADNGTTYDLDDSYLPLVWSYDASDAYSTQQDNRDVGSYGLDYDPVIPCNRTGYTLASNGALTVPTTGSGNCWNGGTWNASQSGNVVSFTVSGYEINSNWFPNTNLGLASGAAIYFDPLKGVESTNIGCFSAGEMFVVVPYKDLESKYGSGTIQLMTKDTDMSATSLTGQTQKDTSGTNDSQAVTNDDSSSDTVYLVSSGDFENIIQYGYYNTSSWGTDVTTNNANAPCHLNGKDETSIGSGISIEWGGENNANGDIDNVMVASDYLMKFDSKALAIDTSQTIKRLSNEDKGTSSITYLYAAKKDGTAWTGDSEMESAKIEDMTYYSSLSDLEAAGKTCIGVLAEDRVPDNAQYARDIDTFSISMKVKSDTSLCGNVYQTVSDSNVWRKGTVTTSDYSVPMIKDVQDGKATLAEYNAGKAVDNHKYNYQKAEYTDGVYTGGHTGDRNQGDSLYLVVYKAGISKTVSQKDSSGDTKKIYDLDANQYTVDYQLSPSMTVENGVTWTDKTTMTITDTLPAGMTYLTGSSNYGGTYAASAKAGYSGTMTGGTAEEPTVTPNSDGTTTLVWIISDVTVEKDVPDIYFKAKMDSTTKNAVIFTNTATINTTEDTREISTENGNTSSVAISTSKTSDISLTKKSVQTTNDIDSSISYEMGWYNNGSKTFTNYEMMDTLPANGDSAGSVYSGTYSITSVKLTPQSGSTTSAYSFYYTTDAAATALTADKVNADEIKAGTSGGVAWSNAAIAADGTVTIDDADASSVKAFVIIGDINGGNNVRAALTIKTDGNASGDRYVNTLSLKSATITTTSYIVKRVLKGVAWEDTNMDGARQSSEKRLSGITVTVYDASGNVAVNADGTKCTAVTDSKGAYEFDDMPAGTFTVKFTSGTTDLGTYKMTTQNASGVGKAVNSDAAPAYDSNGKLQDGTISGITMPESKDIISSPYIVANQDAGFYLPGKLSISKTISGNNADPDKEFTFKLTLKSGSSEISDANEFSYTKSDGTTGTITTGDTLTLKGGQTAVISGIPQGLTYTVTESDNEGYFETDTDTTGTMAAESRAQINNKKSKPVKDVFKSSDTTTSIDGDEVTAGEELEYQITYENTSADDVTTSIADTLPANCTYVGNSAKVVTDGYTAEITQPEADAASGTVTWDKIAVGSGKTVVVSFKVKVKANDGTELDNTSTVNDGKNEYTTNTTKNPVPKDPVKDVFKVSDTTTSVDGKAVTAGEKLVYKITYENTTGSEVKAVITDKLPENCSFVSADNDGTEKDRVVTWKPEVKNGESITVSFTVQVTENNGVELDNQANVNDGKNDSKTNETKNPTTTNPTKDVFEAADTTTSVDGKTVKANDELVYKITYKNTTGEAVTANITDTLPKNCSFVSADNSGSETDGTVTWKDISVASGDSITVSFTVKVTSNNGVELDNQADVNGFKTNETRNPTPTDPVKDVFKASNNKTSIDTKEVTAEEVLMYTITYKNTTGADVTANITDAIPRNCSFVSADNSGTYKDGTVTWSPEVKNGESITVSFNVQVTSNNGVALYNQAAVDDGTNSSKTNETKNYTPTEPVKDVFKASDTSTSIDGDQAAAGDVLLYKVTYTNTTGADVKAVITDKTPDNCAYVDGSADNGGTYAGGTITWKDIDVKNGDSITVSFKVKVDSNNGVELDNTAKVNDGNNDYTTNTTKNPTPSEVTKDVFRASDVTDSVNGKPVTAGEKLVYKITYKNTTGKTVKAAIKDTIPRNCTYVDGSVSDGGTYKSGTLTWNPEVKNGESVTVSFKVTVTKNNGVELTNKAKVNDGTNDYSTNETKNPTPSAPSKDVFRSGGSKSIDGRKVSAGDTLVYRITYKNTTGADVKVTITDEIPDNCTYVKGSADNGGTFSGGKLSWKDVAVASGRSLTVSFKVKVDKNDGTELDNTARVNDGISKYTTNTTKNPTKSGGSTSTTGNGNGRTTPKTGDIMNVGLYAGMALAAAAVIALIAVKSRKEEEKEEE